MAVKVALGLRVQLDPHLAVKQHRRLEVPGPLPARCQLGRLALHR